MHMKSAFREKPGSACCLQLAVIKAFTVHDWSPAHPLPSDGTRREIRMFDFKQLYVGGAVMALAEVVTLVIMVATR